MYFSKMAEMIKVCCNMFYHLFSFTELTPRMFLIGSRAILSLHLYLLNMFISFCKTYRLLGPLVWLHVSSLSFDLSLNLGNVCLNSKFVKDKSSVVLMTN